MKRSRPILLTPTQQYSSVLALASESQVPTLTESCVDNGQKLLVESVVHCTDDVLAHTRANQRPKRVLGDAIVLNGIAYTITGVVSIGRNKPDKIILKNENTVKTIYDWGHQTWTLGLRYYQNLQTQRAVILQFLWNCSNNFYDNKVKNQKIRYRVPTLFARKILVHLPAANGTAYLVVLHGTENSRMPPLKFRVKYNLVDTQDDVTYAMLSLCDDRCNVYCPETTTQQVYNLSEHQDDRFGDHTGLSGHENMGCVNISDEL